MADETHHFYDLSVLTPEKTAFQGQVYSFIAPGADGYLEVLAHHAPLVSLIQPGKLTITDKEDQKHIYAVSSGILEVSNNRANLLVDAIEPADQIDIARARLAYERAKTRLLSLDSDHARARKALQRAENRIKIYQEMH